MTIEEKKQVETRLIQIFKDAFKHMTNEQFEEMHEIMIQEDVIFADIGGCAYAAMAEENDERN